MNNGKSFSEKLEKVLFLEVDENKLENIFKVTIKEKVYLPINADEIIKEVKNGNNMEKISISNFIEGMFFVMGADKDFKYNKYYIKMIKNIPESIKFIKGKIFKLIEEKKYEDAYITLKGLIQVDSSKENFEKLLLLVDGLRSLDKSYIDEELWAIDKTKELFEDYPLPYLYECIINKENGDYSKALFLLNNYLVRGGEETKEITDLRVALKSIVDYEKAKEILYDSPREALEILIPLLEEFEDDPLIYYYVSIAYRILENYEKAIYYLNKSINIDSAIPEVINELGINYAALGEYEKAIGYLRKVFEVTKAVEVCTNLVMCYLNIGKIKEAKEHLEIAKKIKPEDEIVMELEGILKKYIN
ncbi:capsular biosynthesis protein [Clostridium cochlearium]|uniref:tetratricopeptide repeat protein n=1 Tax=Clostridium cochlearium TaxID=1494 RepID=UPI00145991EF|nr:capsular biosynthesis protein [Clostridium cochlearium]NME94491.1 capsular biosynthesis protein [Clostridium cochlearium]NSJ91790.1 capsular biosynthesis protein [Coprococcus sp. MSK.21.13]